MFKIDFQDISKSNKSIQKMKWASISFNAIFLLAAIYLMILLVMCFNSLPELYEQHPEQYSLTINLFFISGFMIFAWEVFQEFIIITSLTKSSNYRSKYHSYSLFWYWIYPISWFPISKEYCGKMLEFKKFSTTIENYINGVLNSGRQITNYEYQVIAGFVSTELAKQKINSLYNNPKENCEVPTTEQYLSTERKKVVDNFKNISLIMLCMSVIFYATDYFIKSSLLSVLFVVWSYLVSIGFVSLFVDFVISYSEKYLLKPISFNDVETVDSVLKSHEQEFKIYMQGVAFQSRQLYRQELYSLQTQYRLAEENQKQKQQELECKKLYDIA
jgi:hypothetical protein